MAAPSGPDLFGARRQVESADISPRGREPPCDRFMEAAMWRMAATRLVVGLWYPSRPAFVNFARNGI
ncbi:MAG: hypothetical protein LBE86_03830 [Gemmobacter sp.]|jgi:hypothetical protein|nr:hypothetical protein [Gemmobacter sp.]